MAALANRKPIMTLYSGKTCIYSHTSRIVLFEKDVECQVRFVSPGACGEELAALNPYNETPTLVDRDLILYGYRVINEYLDERLPHPPLMPVDPVSRARARLMIMRLHRDWLRLFDRVGEDGHGVEHARRVIRDGMISISPVFSEQPYMLGAEFSLVDCCIGPLLWRLSYFGIELPRQARPVLDYAERLFGRKSFKASLSEAEVEMR